jgi:hypothetical protein
VLTQGHVPILNVLYENDFCGPYRDWQWQEHNFVANGTDVAPGFRWCNSPPETIIDNNSDAGNFNGVAIYEDLARGQLVLVSEMTAGWYRYISEWTFSVAGWIQPRFKFAATASSCVCRTHYHHCYWRLNFNIDETSNDTIDEWNEDIGWKQLKNEIKRNRDASVDRKWRVRNAATGAAFEIVPGEHDGTAEGDAYARSDMWFLRNRSTEIDDHYNNTGGAGTAANLDPFITGESIDRQDLVVWYGGHFRHQLTPNHAGDDHIVGPAIIPVCTAQASGDGVLSAGDLEELRTFRDDELLQVSAGKAYREMLRQHTDELMELILHDDQIKQTMGSVAKQLADVVREARERRPVPPEVPDQILADATALLDLLDQQGSSRLQATISAARADLEQFRGSSLLIGIENMVGPV